MNKRESSGQTIRRLRRKLLAICRAQDLALADHDSVTFRELESERVEVKCELEGMFP